MDNEISQPLKGPSPLSVWVLLDGVILAVGVYLRFETLAHRVWWTDEIVQLEALRGYSLKNLLVSYLPIIPGGFPGDYLLTWPMAQVTSNKWALAAPHIMATLLTFGLFLKIRRDERGHPLATAVALLMMTLNRNLIFHDFELRPYGVLPLLALGSYWATDRMFHRQTYTRQDAVLWIGWVFTLLLFHTYGILILGSLWMFQLLKSIPLSRLVRAQVWRLAGLTALAVTLALPLWLFYAKVPGTHHDPFAYCRPSVSGVLAFFLGNLGDWGWRFSWIPGTLLMFSSCFFVQDTRWRPHLLFILVLLVIPLGMIFMSDVLCHYWFVQRQFTWAMPLWALAIARSMDLWTNRNSFEEPPTG